MSLDIGFSPALRLGTAIHDRALTSTDVVKVYLERIGRYNRKLNAVVGLNPSALDDARRADNEIDSGFVRSPLHGVPFTVKDHLATAGIPTTSGFRPYGTFLPAADADIVALMKALGGVLLGKTNLPPFGFDFQTDNPLFGPTANPWSQEHTPGGSTGGGAAALATGLTPLEIGSDLAGSCRIPAHCCGVFGFKPSVGKLPAGGINPGPLGAAGRVKGSMTSIGLLSRYPDDIAALYGLLSGEKTSAGGKSSPVKIAWCDSFGYLQADSAVRKAMRLFLESLDPIIYTVREHMPPVFMENTVMRLFGKLLDHDYIRHIPAGILLSLPGRLLWAKFPGTPSTLIPTRKDRLLWYSIRRELAEEFAAFMNVYDLFVSPVLPGPAPPRTRPIPLTRTFPLYLRNLRIDETYVNYYLYMCGFTAPVNALDFPAVAGPVGFSSDGLPIGIQAVGRRGGEHDLLRHAVSLFPPFTVPPRFP